MSDEPKKRSRRWDWWMAIPTLMLAYPLSAGPAIRMAAHVGSPEAFAVFSVIYRPLGLACQQTDTTLNALNWYLERWQ
jgi:hypothetical protein